MVRGGQSPPDELVNALSFIEARIDEADLTISSLQPEMLLRDVLTSELQNIRKRLSDVERQMRRRAPSKSLSIVHALLRELERIGRISQVAGLGTNEPAPESETSSISMPQSISDAYRVLGINADAAPAVTKKLVDALRMSWHPDHARDESDRQRREGRMKQINAAWDLIKDRRAAA
jgi:DnaJ-domain-containing protein 1